MRQKAPLLEKNRPADFPRQRDRQFTAEFFPNVADRVRGRRPEQGDSRDLTLVEHSYCRPVSEAKLLFDEELPRVKGNGGKLQQVFLNLILNARDAMEARGQLAVRTSAATAWCVLRWRYGRGITPENLARIFDPFFTPKARAKGTGLGSFGELRIVREHGGDIEVEKHAGAGTRFLLSFPQTAPAWSSSKVPRCGKSRRVLLPSARLRHVCNT